MPSGITPNKGYVQPTVNGDKDAWGTPTNTNWSTVDTNLGGGTTVSVAGAVNVVATAAAAQNLHIVLNGVLTGNIQYQLPAVGGFWIIDNSTTGAFTLSIATVAAGTAVIVPQGYRAHLFSDGTNISFSNTATDNFKVQTNLAVGGTLAVTGATSLAGDTAIGSKFVVTAASGDTGIQGVLTVTGTALSGAVTGWLYNNVGGGAVGPIALNYSLQLTAAAISTQFFATSDAREKEDITPLTPIAGMTWVLRAEPVTYVKRGIQEAGLIAQDQMRTGYGRFVATVEDPGMLATDYRGVISPNGQKLVLNYDNYIAHLIAALQHADMRIRDLETRIRRLEGW